MESNSEILMWILDRYEIEERGCDVNLYACRRCGAAIMTGRLETHNKWHERQEGKQS